MKLSPVLSVLPLLLASAAWAGPPNRTSVAGLDVVSGKKVDLRLNSASKANVLVFVSALCPCSGSHEAALKDLSRTFSSQGFQFVGIHSNTDESAEITKSHFEISAFPFPILQDEGAALADAWGALKTPHVFVVTPAGEILYQGGVDETHDQKEAKKPYLRDALTAIQAGKRPEIAQTRSLGCMIKR